MINELIQLSEVIDKNNINTGIQWNTKMLEGTKAQAFKILIDINGNLSKIEVFDSDSWLKSRRYEPNKFKSFPSFKILEKEVINKEQYDKLKNKDIDFISKLKENTEQYKEINKKFTKFKNSIDLGIELFTKEDDNLKSVISLINRLKKSKYNELFVDIFIKLCEMNDEKTMCKCKDGMYLCLEIDDYEKYDLPVQNSKTYEYINKYISDSKNTEDKEKQKNIELDDFGFSKNGYDEAGFNTCLGGLKNKNIIIYSNNKDAICNTRYGKNGSESCKIGYELRQKTISALQYITEKSKENKNWKLIKDIEDKLIIGYFTSDLNNDKFFEASFYDEENNDESFSEKSKNIFNILNLEKDANSNSEYRLFCVSMTEKGKTKVTNSFNLNIENLINRYKEWENGYSNLSRFFKVPNITKVFRMLNDKNIKRVTLSEILELYFNNSEVVLNKIIKIISNEYLKYFANKNKKENNKEIFFKKLNIPYVMSLIGYLLYEKKIYKENYMKNWAYAIGQVCCVADRLQELCFEDRGMKVPQKRIGNECFSLALINPQRAFASIQNRMAPYLNFAKNNRNKGFFNYCLLKLKELNKCLEDQTIPNFNSDLDRIQIGIGYNIGLEGLDKNKEEIVK